MPPGLNLLGGLAGAGAQGASGAFEGMIEGETLRRKFAGQDLQNQLHMLEMILKQRQATQPAFSVHGDRLMIQPPGGAPAFRELPPTQAGAARIQALTDQASLARQRAELADQRYQSLQQKDVYGQYVKILGEQGSEAAAKYLDQVRTVAQAQHPAQGGLIGTIETKVAQSPAGVNALAPGERAVWDAHHKPVADMKPVIHQWDDDQGQRHESATTFDTKTGRWDTQTRIIGAGKGRPPEKPTEGAKALTDYMTANKIPDTAEGRSGARQAMSTGKADSTMELFERREKVKEQIKESAELRKAAAKEQTSEQKRTGTLGDIARMRQLAGEINQAGLMPPTGTTGIGMWIANKKREWWDPGNAALTAFRGLFGPIMIGEIDRGIFDEKGVRAIQAFRANFDMLERIPPYTAVDRFLKEIEGSIQSKMKSSGVAPGAQAGALAPGIPAGAHREGGDVVSDSGKYVWRDGQWQPRR